MHCCGNTNNWVQSHVINVPLKYARKKLQFSAGGTESNGAIWIAFIGSEKPSVRGTPLWDMNID